MLVNRADRQLDQWASAAAGAEQALEDTVKEAKKERDLFPFGHDSVSLATQGWDFSYLSEEEKDIIKGAEQYEIMPEATAQSVGERVSYFIRGLMSELLKKANPTVFLKLQLYHHYYRIVFLDENPLKSIQQVEEIYHDSQISPKDKVRAAFLLGYGVVIRKSPCANVLKYLLVQEEASKSSIQLNTCIKVCLFILQKESEKKRFIVDDSSLLQAAQIDGLPQKLTNEARWEVLNMPLERRSRLFRDEQERTACEAEWLSQLMCGDSDGMRAGLASCHLAHLRANNQTKLMTDEKAVDILIEDTFGTLRLGDRDLNLYFLAKMRYQNRTDRMDYKDTLAFLQTAKLSRLELLKSDVRELIEGLQMLVLGDFY